MRRAVALLAASVIASVACGARSALEVPHEAADLRACADGTREGFLDASTYPDIAACAGGFTVPGLLGTVATCGRKGGNDGPDPTGDGCAGAGDAPPGSFFATGQSGPGCDVCATGTQPDCGNNSCQQGCAPSPTMANDVFGCGNVGDIPDPTSCAPLDRFGNNLCAALPPPWSCPMDPAGADVSEALLVTKPGADGGGVLCCRD